jgi:hypothetical protein
MAFLCFAVMLEAQAFGAVAARGAIRQGPAEPTVGDLSKQVSNLQTRVDALTKEVEDLKNIVAKTGTSSSVARAAVSSNEAPMIIDAAPPPGQVPETPAAISGPANSVAKRDIMDAASKCHEITAKSKCDSSYFSDLLGYEIIPGLEMTTSGLDNASIKQACDVGCGVGFSGTLKAGVRSQTSSCIVLPFYDVDNDYRLRCAAFEFDNRTVMGTSVCRWDDDGGRCMTAQMVCSSGGYCYSGKR